MKAFSLLIGLASWLLSCAAHAESSVLPRLDIAALAASESRLFVGGFDAGLWVVERDGTARPFDDAALNPHINALVWSERDRVLWVGTARGLVRCPASSACVRLGPSSAVHALLLRQDGSLLVGGDAGLVFVKDERSQVVGKKQGAPYRSVWALGESADGTLFVGATNGLFWGDAHTARARGHVWQRASLVSGTLPDDWVTALLVQGQHVHVGTYNSGLVTFRATRGRLEPEAEDSSLGYVNPGGVIATSGGELAIATMDGLRQGLPGDTQLRETQGRDITAIVPAWQGGYWVGTRQGLEWIRLSAV